MPLAAANSDHLSTYSFMDISLDPFPYAGRNTRGCANFLFGCSCVCCIKALPFPRFCCKRHRGVHEHLCCCEALLYEHHHLSQTITHVRAIRQPIFCVCVMRCTSLNNRIIENVTPETSNTNVLLQLAPSDPSAGLASLMQEEEQRHCTLHGSSLMTASALCELMASSNHVCQVWMPWRNLFAVCCFPVHQQVSRTSSTTHV